MKNSKKETKKSVVNELKSSADNPKSAKKKIKKIIYEPKDGEPVVVFSSDVSELPKETLKGLVEFGESFNDSIENFKVDENLDRRLQAMRKNLFYERLPGALGLNLPDEIFQREDVKRFIEFGLDIPFEEKIDAARFFFFINVLHTAPTPVDLRKEIDVMMRALQEVNKSLPKKRAGRKRDEFLYSLVQKIETGKLSKLTAFQKYREKNGLLPKVYFPEEYHDFLGKIRKIKSSLKQGKTEKSNNSRKIPS